MTKGQERNAACCRREREREGRHTERNVSHPAPVLHTEANGEQFERTCSLFSTWLAADAYDAHVRDERPLVRRFSTSGWQGLTRPSAALQPPQSPFSHHPRPLLPTQMQMQAQQPPPVDAAEVNALSYPPPSRSALYRARKRLSEPIGRNERTIALLRSTTKGVKESRLPTMAASQRTVKERTNRLQQQQRRGTQQAREDAMQQTGMHSEVKQQRSENLLQRRGMTLPLRMNCHCVPLCFAALLFCAAETLQRYSLL